MGTVVLRRKMALLPLLLVGGCQIVVGSLAMSDGGGDLTLALSDGGADLPLAMSDGGDDLTGALEDVWICSPEDLGCVRPPDLLPRLDLAPPIEAPFCPTTCAPACAAGTDCVASGTVAAGCHAPCRVTDDCPAGLSCVGLDPENCGTLLNISDAQPRHCLPRDAPLCAGAAPGTIFGGNHCDKTDPDIYSGPFNTSFGCAFSYSRCKGCQILRPDGGFALSCQ